MKLRVAGLFLMLGAASTTAVADSIDVNLRDKAVRLTYAANLSSGGLNADFGILHNEDKKQLDDTLYHAGLLVSGENWSESGTFDISLGGRLIYTSPGTVDLGALAFGGKLRFSPVHRLGIGGSIFYAPSITSFGDADRYVESSVQIDYQVLPQAFIYIGYRNIEVDIENGPDNIELDEGGIGGFKVLF
jgi:hypothetical protein